MLNAQIPAGVCSLFESVAYEKIIGTHSMYNMAALKTSLSNEQKSQLILHSMSYCHELSDLEFDQVKPLIQSLLNTLS